MPTPKKTTSKKDYNQLALAVHKKLKGKLEVVSKGSLKTKDDWSTLYTPGVGAVSMHLAKNPKDARLYTIKKQYRSGNFRWFGGFRFR